ncbi:TIR domain-containing protein [Lysobacter enzymogenes]|uniref:TIR domain-containing protein n=1 Tax=Lysobacter enzymogenes TaxID=69 RepID=UPI00089C20CC|nr:TIR domain-containing protein [Lysobacter enzymogenes]SDX15407.1 TIR domain-containing protein [Lysobacter enzymogenes]
MKVFISWSGDRSREVADLLRDWLSCVIQAVKPWVSTRDIDRGALWFGEISGQLQDTAVGIICLTQENKERPWILFEAGALAKGLSTARVCTLLIDLQPGDVREPLSQFNHTFPIRESMLSLVRTLNGALGEKGLEQGVLEQVFETYFSQFDQKFKAIIANTVSQPNKEIGPEDDVLNEILAATRALSRRVGRIESTMSRRAGNLFGSPSTPSPVQRNDEAPEAAAVKRAFEEVSKLAAEGASKNSAMSAAMKFVDEVTAGFIVSHFFGTT